MGSGIGVKGLASGGERKSVEEEVKKAKWEGGRRT